MHVVLGIDRKYTVLFGPDAHDELNLFKLE